MLRLGTPHTPETQGLNGRLASVGENSVNAGDLQASLSRLPSGQYDGGSLTFNSIQPGVLDDTLQQQYGGGMDSVYGLNGLDGNGYNSYGFESGGRAGANSTGTSGSTALYRHNGSRYGLGLPTCTNSDGGMNGLHGRRTSAATWTVNSTDSQERASRTCKTKFPLSARTGTATDACKRSCYTALDYVEPTQRALLVELIRPVLPLIRNTLYGKRIQNKLQREQMDHFSGGDINTPSLAPLGTQGMVPQGRHMSFSLHFDGLADIYVGQGGLYGQSSFGQTHMGRHHSLGHHRRLY
ncbi:RNA-binding protein [Mycena sanguinolenta]|uniref:RNA-binding protein n=1 Tax=Mycena sanguinolenta TaxID=230812 RepID=A0A8H6YEZ2_9AGAR|nr:RNA-binding protein [Mycena sanguinolenta]